MVVILHSMTVQQGSEIKTKILLTPEIKKMIFVFATARLKQTIWYRKEFNQEESSYLIET